MDKKRERQSVMAKSIVSIVRYERPFDSVRRAVELSNGMDFLLPGAKVFVKPNILTWSKSAVFPKWGAITTSRVVEDVVKLLKDRGVHDITIGEGMVLLDIKDRDTQKHAFESLGYGTLKKRYGIKYFSVWERPFEKVDIGEGIFLKYNMDALHSHLLINLPVLKTHNLAKVSLGMKNLKGLLDIASRKRCHQQDNANDLYAMIAKLARKLPPCFTLLDGLFTLEKGPTWEGKARRSNLLVASSDIFSADMVGARVLGFDPCEVPYLVEAAKDRERPLDLSDVQIRGAKIEDVASPHEYQFPYNDDGTLPLPFEKMGVRGLSYPPMDSTLCTYCSTLTGPTMASIAMSWKGEPWDEVEVLTGKVMKPTLGKKKTILFGKCMYIANKDDPNIKEMIAIKGCPPRPGEILSAFRQAGIELDPRILDNLANYPGLAMKKYKGRPEFDESFFTVT
jgi:uncharacterized protein (DUF362 family)